MNARAFAFKGLFLFTRRHCLLFSLKVICGNLTCPGVRNEVEGAVHLAARVKGLLVVLRGRVEGVAVDEIALKY